MRRIACAVVRCPSLSLFDCRRRRRDSRRRREEYVCSFNSAPSSFSRGGGRKRCLRRTVVASLEDNTNTNNGDESSLVNTAHAVTSSTPYAVLEGTVVLAILALIDCGWSGDWSRIGAVTQENEAQARWLCVNVVFPRALCDRLGHVFRGGFGGRQSEKRIQIVYRRRVDDD